MKKEVLHNFSKKERKMKKFALALIILSICFLGCWAGGEIEPEVLTISDLPSEGVLVGEIVSVDVEAETITVKVDGVERTFIISPNETIMWRGTDEVMGVEDIKVGEITEVGYFSRSKTEYVASWIDIVVDP